MRYYFLLFFLFLSFISFSEIPEFSSEVKEISNNLRCPVCQGLSVKESNTEIAIDMKNKVKELLAKGNSEDQVYEYFAKRYGEWILRVPRKVGFNQFLWFIPYLFFLFGVLFFGFIGWKKWQKNKALRQQKETSLSEKEEEEIKSILSSD